MGLLLATPGLLRLPAVGGGFDPVTDDANAYSIYDLSDASTVNTVSRRVSDKLGLQSYLQYGTELDGQYGTRLQGASNLNTLDLQDDTNNALYQFNYPLPESIAFHMAVVIDASTDANDSAFGLKTAGGASNYALSAYNASDFLGTARVGDYGSTFGTNISGSGPHTGLTIFSIIIDRAANTHSLYTNGTLTGTAALNVGIGSATVDSFIFGSNNARNRTSDMALCELDVTETLSNQADYYSYLSDKWT